MDKFCKAVQNLLLLCNLHVQYYNDNIKKHVTIFTVSCSDTVMAILSHDDGFKALQLKTKSLTKKSWKEKSLNEILISWIKKSAIDKGNSLTPMELLIKHLPG